jgi:hypothetical protein
MTVVPLRMKLLPFNELLHALILKRYFSNIKPKPCSSFSSCCYYYYYMMMMMMMMMIIIIIIIIIIDVITIK